MKIEQEIVFNVDEAFGPIKPLKTFTIADVNQWIKQSSDAYTEDGKLVLLFDEPQAYIVLIPTLK